MINKWLKIGAGVAACIPLFAIVFQYNPVSNAAQIKVMKRSMFALENRLEQRVIRDDIRDWEDQIFQLELEYGSDPDKQPPVVRAQIHRLRQQIEEARGEKIILENKSDD